MAARVVPGPDRSWIPTYSRDTDYFTHSPKSAVLEFDRNQGGIPPGFPQSVVSPKAWSGADLQDPANRDRYSLILDEAHIRELEQACLSFKELGLPFEDISQVTFPLPTLGDKLKTWAMELTSGVGFFHMRGLDPQKYSNETNIVIYLGISAYVGKKRGRQDELGNMLLHLTDVGPEVATENERQAPYSNVGQPFHTDAGDIIALYSLGEAEFGGESQLASTATVYNEIVKTRPDIIRLLSSSSWVFDSFGQRPSYTVRPILYPLRDENLLLSFSRRPLVGNASSPRSPHIPDLSAPHVEAINAIHFAAEKHALSMKLKPGDLLFWNNLALLHARTGFTDSPDHRRHLLRLWLRNDETERMGPIPAGLKASWDDAFDHAGRPQLWPLQPIRDRDYVIKQTRSSGHG